MRFAAVLGLALVPSALIAQPAPGQPGLQPAVLSGIALEEIVVTALKREQLLQDVPVSVSVMSAASLQRAVVRTLEDVTHQVPMLEVQASTNSLTTSLRIRRIGNLGNIPTFEPAVGLFIDGAYRSRPVYAANDLFDLERVEILRSPQSTLYGKNTTGGVVGLFTRPPEREFNVGGELSLGTLDGARQSTSRQLKARVEGALSARTAGSLGLAWTDAGYTFSEAVATQGSPANDIGRYTLRGSFVWDASPATQWRLIATHTREDDHRETSDVTYDPAGVLYNSVLPAWRAAGISDTCADNDPHNRVTCIMRPLTTDLTAEEVTLLMDHTFANDWTLASVTSWDRFRFRGTMNDAAQMQAPLLQFHDAQASRAWQQELRLASPAGSTVDWLAGVFVYGNDNYRGDHGARAIYQGDTLSAHPVVAATNRQLFNTPIPLPIAAAGQQGFLDSGQETGYFGVYGQGNWSVTDRFRLIAGLRWQEESKDAWIRQWTNTPAPSVLSQFLTPAAVSAEALARDSSRVTWTLTSQWQWSEDLMLFANVASGYKSGGFNTASGRLPIAQREFADEKVMHYEAGFKYHPDTRYSVAANVFMTEYEDYQDAAFVGGQFSVGNAEEARVDGVELEGVARIGEHYSVDFAVSLADLRYREYLRGLCYPGRTPDSPVLAGACVLSGEHPVNAPKWKTHVGLQYARTYDLGQVALRADWSWSDAYNTSFSADPRLRQKAYHWVDLNAALSRGNWDLVLWAKNVGNVTVVNYDAVLTTYARDGSYQSLLQAPRSYGLTLRSRY